MRKRDLNIELMRLVLMYLICMIHAVGYVPARWDHWLTNICFMGVLGFVLISGYFGIRFSWMKALKLEGVGVGCAMTVIALSLPFDPANRSIAHAFNEVVRLWKGYWFIHAYVVMMCLAPLVEHLFEDCEIEKLRNLKFHNDQLHNATISTTTPNPKPQTSNLKPQTSTLKLVLPVLLLVYGWSFLMLVPGIQKFVPRTPGLEAFSGITLFAVYLVGRLYRSYELDSKFSVKWVVPVTLAAALVSACVIPPSNGWGGIFARYNSPSLLIFALGFFWLFRRLRRGYKPQVTNYQPSTTNTNPSTTNYQLQTLLTWIGPSIFSIYLIHCNDYGYKVFGQMESWLAGHGCGSYLVFLALATSAFFGCLLLDIPRRLVAWALLKIVKL